MNYVRRFVFVHYDDFLNIRFKKLEKVTDKLYVFISDSVEQMPVWMVRQVQDMGRDLEWVDVSVQNRELTNSIMAFTIGTLHEKVDLGVEFAILSDDDKVDALVEYIQDNGRNCVRVQQKGANDDAMEPRNEKSGIRSFQAQKGTISNVDLDDEMEDLDLDDEDEGQKPQGFDDYSIFKESGSSRQEGEFKLRPSLKENASTSVDTREVNVSSMADDVVRRLIRSGNRPADVSMLRSYILLHSDDPKTLEYVQDMIEHMSRTGEILSDEGTIKYNF